MALAESAVAEATSGDGMEAGDLARFWSRLIEAVGRVSPFTRAYLLDLQPVSFSGNRLVIGYTPEFSDRLALVDNARTRELLRNALSEAGHREVHIQFTKVQPPPGGAAKPSEAVPAAASPPPGASGAAGSPARSADLGTSSSAAAPTSLEEFKNDPLIRRALEIFRGQIVSVRA